MKTRFWTERRQIYARFAFEVAFAIVFTIWLHGFTKGKYGVGFAMMLVCLDILFLYVRLKKHDSKRAAMTDEERMIADAPHSPQVFSRRKTYWLTFAYCFLATAGILYFYPKWSVTRTVLSTIVIAVAIAYTHYSRIRKLESH